MKNLSDLRPSPEVLSHLPDLVYDCMCCSEIGFSEYDDTDNWSFDNVCRRLLKIGENVTRESDDYCFIHLLFNACEKCICNPSFPGGITKDVIDFLTSNGYGYSFAIPLDKFPLLEP